MKTRIEPIDFFCVEPQHREIDHRLTEWSRWVEVRRVAGQAPIWRLGKSNGRQWYAPELRPSINVLDAMKTEKAVGALPGPPRYALRWAYCYRYSPARAIRDLDCTYEELAKLIHSGRTMIEKVTMTG